MGRRRKFWGWGYEDEDLSRAEKEQLAALLASRFGGGELTVTDPPSLAEVELRAPRFQPPASLREILTDDPYERAGHTYGKSYRDVVRAYRRDFRPAPDWVALPRNEEEVAALLALRRAHHRVLAVSIEEPEEGVRARLRAADILVDTLRIGARRAAS